MPNITVVARSARLFLTPEQQVLYQANIDRMIEWFKDIYNTSETECIYSVVSEDEARNYFHDEIENVENTASVLKNTPKVKENFILVPKVI